MAAESAHEWHVILNNERRKEEIFNDTLQTVDRFGQHS
ncbi:hypothetical protein X758_11300 [Mesorhizobium sp. LSHC416B00]|nr:hypothetical protein X761_11965 [Mesorhizobium sp. LSHC424B00]ESX73070.1 hypothetical protein X758_11300 [Mesorhizobium sp. LSHC416B00]